MKMYIPMTWAHPYILKLLKEKREIEDLDNAKPKKSVKDNRTKAKAFGMLYRTLAFGRMF